MKIGIVTFHRAHNFGAVLQCLALKTVLSDLGYVVCIVDHRNKKIEQFYELQNPINFEFGLIFCIKSVTNFCLTLIPKLLRIIKFKSFINKYLINSHSVQDSCGSIDCIVYGSDQIWRGELTDNDDFYWGRSYNENVKKISYSASAGFIDENFARNIDLLRDFSAISVRESDLKDTFDKNGIGATVTIDPTLLIDKDRWVKLIPLKPSVNKPYVLVYSMRNRKKVLDVAEHISGKEQMPIIEIFNNNISWREILEPYNAGDPIDFISLIKDATYIVTDSFHGTAFSVIFNKQFVTVELKDGHDNRAKSLLSILGIADRMSETGLNYYEEIDYCRVKKSLDIIKENSLNFLKTALSDK